MIVGADTAPLRHLILIEQIDVLRALYGEVVIPPAVLREMLSSGAPVAVRAWAQDLPAWLKVRTPSHWRFPPHPALDAGELEAMALVRDGATGSILIIDERIGRREASRLGIEIVGTLGILQEAHERGLLDLREAVHRLRRTTFHIHPALLRKLE